MQPGGGSGLLQLAQQRLLLLGLLALQGGGELRDLVAREVIKGARLDLFSGDACAENKSSLAPFILFYDLGETSDPNPFDLLIFSRSVIKGAFVSIRIDWSAHGQARRYLIPRTRQHQVRRQP
jgi:hypothetical protein